MFCQVLTDNIVACRKLPHSTVWKMFQLATNSDNKEFYEFIPTIEAWMKVRICFISILLYNSVFYNRRLANHHLIS